MENFIYPEAAVLAIFGAGGDLTRRKLVPALYDLFLDRYLPERFVIVGIDLQPLNDERFRQLMREGVDQFSRRGKIDDATWQAFAQRLSFLSANFADSATFTSLGQQLNDLDHCTNSQSAPAPIASLCATSSAAHLPAHCLSLPSAELPPARG